MQTLKLEKLIIAGNVNNKKFPRTEVDGKGVLQRRNQEVQAPHKNSKAQQVVECERLVILNT